MKIKRKGTTRIHPIDCTRKTLLERTGDDTKEKYLRFLPNFRTLPNMKNYKTNTTFCRNDSYPYKLANTKTHLQRI